VEDCTFCGILAGDIPASRVDEDDRSLAFLDIAPFSVGHTLVVPKSHEPSIRRLAEPDAAAMWRTARRVARAMRGALTECEGVSFLAADGEAAGQEVPHAHLHVVPRRAGDGLGFRLPPNHGAHEPRSTLDAIAERIRRAIE
jgi:diadenosine tetraphosphate (Ap4A) HIT family hydrolase